MSITSTLIRGGGADGTTRTIVLRTLIDDMEVSTYVTVAPPDLDLIADIVPPDEADAGGAIHATAIPSSNSAEDEVYGVLENMNPGDIAVFLCAGQDGYDAALALLGCARQH
jgi:hypothetical protein